MAQAGLFSSSDSMNMRPYKQLFTRILNNDNIFKSQSSFAVEMSELRGILKRCDNNSIVLGDELCSGTESISALSIVSTGISRLSENNVNFIFASHLHSLKDLPIIKHINNLGIYHLKVEFSEGNGYLQYLRTLTPGSGPSIYGLEVCRAMGLDQEFIRQARKTQLLLTEKNTDILTQKKSVYSSEMYMDKCEICSKDACDTHHISEQHTADENGMIGDFHKNMKFNLVALCKDCHHEVHHGNLFIEGYIQTSNGIRLKYKKDNLSVENNTLSSKNNTLSSKNNTLSSKNNTLSSENNPPSENNLSSNNNHKLDNIDIKIKSPNKNKRKKFNKNTIELIKNYKDEKKFNSISILKQNLFTEKNIKISIKTLQKILNNEY